MNDYLRELFRNYDSGALLHLYRANSAVLEQDRRNVAKMEEILEDLKHEIERRGLGGNISQDTNSVQEIH